MELVFLYELGFYILLGKELLTKLHKECKSVSELGHQVLAGTTNATDGSQTDETEGSTQSSGSSCRKLTQVEAEGLLPKVRLQLT